MRLSPPASRLAQADLEVEALIHEDLLEGVLEFIENDTRVAVADDELVRLDPDRVDAESVVCEQTTDEDGHEAAVGVNWLELIAIALEPWVVFARVQFGVDRDLDHACTA